MTVKERKYTFPEAMWAGTDQSLEVAMDAYEHIMAGVFGAQPGNDSEEEVPYTFSQQGEVGIVTIRGSLVNRDSMWNQFCGVTSYSEIRRSVIHATLDDNIKAILLDIDSGGGAVAGCADCGELIAMVHDKVKPVYAFSGGTMASAAIWLGLAAGSNYVSASTISGSIGVIATHQEYSKALKEAGVGVTVMRAGEYKALVNSFEPLSEVAKKQLQDQLNSAYALFIGFAADRRNTTVTQADSKFGQGREFFGSAAVDAGLSDGVTNFDGMMSMIQKKLIDTSAKKDNTAINYPRGQDMTRQALTEQQVAAIAAGAPGTAPALDAAALAAAAVALAAAAPAAVAPAAAPVVVAPAAVTQPQSGNDAATLLSYLQGQVKEKDAAFLAQTLELNAAKAKVSSMEATHAGLVKIAATSLANMKIGMGMAKADFSAMAPELLLAEHTSTATAFATHFKVGGVAAVSASETQDNKAVEPDLMHQARIDATRFSSNTK